MAATESLNAAFDELDPDGNGYITAEAFERFRAGLGAPLPGTGLDSFRAVPARAPAAAAPPEMQASAPMPLIMVPKKPTAEDALVEDEGLLRDARRGFAIAGTMLLGLVSFVPCWGASMLLQSPTYLYFSAGGASGVGPALFLLDFVVFWYMFFYEGVMPRIPLCSGMDCCKCLSILPSETYFMTVLTICLLILWKVLPMLYLGWIEVGINWSWYYVQTMWYSSDPAAVVITCCFSGVLLYVLSLSYFFVRASGEAKRRVSSMFFIWTVSAMLMGVSFLLVTRPMKDAAMVAHDELMNACETGPRTSQLFVASQALQSMRQTPGCKELPSVEQCSGFQETEITRVLKSMESEFRCSGFCYDPRGIHPLVDATVPKSVALQPPTLFSQAMYEASCEGMAARSMQNTVLAVATQVSEQGVVIVAVALVLAMLYVAGSCVPEAKRPPEDEEREKEDFIAKIEDLTMTIDSLVKNIEGLKAEIAEMQVQLKRAGEDREKQNKEFQSTVADQREVQKLLTSAVKVLKEVYAKVPAASLAQLKKQEPAGPPPPAGFEGYKKSAQSGGVLSLLTQIISDAKAMEAEAIRAEEDSQKAYEDFVKETNGSVEAKSKDIVDKSQLKAKAESDLVKNKEAKESTMVELQQLSNYNSELHSSCDFVVKNFELRQTARDEEVEALKQAKAILSGADFQAAA